MKRNNSVLLIVLFLLCINLSGCNYPRKTTISEEYVKSAIIPNSSKHYADLNYVEVMNELSALGFHNFKVIRTGISPLVNNQNDIYEMRVNGRKDFSSGEYGINSEIIFYVYSYDFTCPYGHQIVMIDASDPTCLKEGNYQYFYCAECDCCYDDSKGNGIPHSPEKYIIERKKHVPEKLDSCTLDGYSECYQCSLCKHYFEDIECTKEIKEEDAVK